MNYRRTNTFTKNQKFDTYMHSKKSTLLFTLVSLLFLSLGCSSGNKEQVVLKLIQNVGDEYTIVFTTEAKSSAEMSMDDRTEMKFKVTAVDADNDAVIYHYIADVIHMKSEFRMGTDVEYYDSNKNESSMSPDELFMHNSLKTVLDSNLFIDINAHGEIIKPYHLSSGISTEDPIDMSVIQLRFPKEPVGEGFRGTMKGPFL